VSLIAQTRPLSATRGKVFFDICILGRKYNFGESEMEVRLHLYRYQNNQATKGV
jgi:hypothetical protein